MLYAQGWPVAEHGLPTSYEYMCYECPQCANALLQHDQLEKLHSPIAASELSGAYDRQKAGENERLALAIWTADFAACMEALRAANVELVAVLDAQITSSTPVAVAHKQRQLDGVLLNLVRAQSIHKVPVLTAALSVMCEAYLVKREFHDAISFLMKGALMSETFTEQFAASRRIRVDPASVGVACAIGIQRTACAMRLASSRVKRSHRQLQQHGSPSLSKAHGRQQQSFRANSPSQEDYNCVCGSQILAS